MFKLSPRNARKLFRNSVRFFVLFAIAVLAGCSTTKSLTSASTACDIYPEAEYVVLGKTQWDQDKVDEYVAVGTQVCGKLPPKPRPPSFDTKRATPAPAPASKPTLWQRTKARVAGSVAPLPRERPASAPLVPPDPPPPAPAPRDPLDVLLGR